MKSAIRRALAAGLAILATSAAALPRTEPIALATQRTETIALGAAAVASWLDAQGGIVVTATEGAGRAGLLAPRSVPGHRRDTRAARLVPEQAEGTP